ncbi:unnamed protein product [Parajaminaea phylloscopi]
MSRRPASILPGGVVEHNDDVEMDSAGSEQDDVPVAAAEGDETGRESSDEKPDPSSPTAPAPPQEPQQFDDPNLLASYPIYLSTSLPASSKLHLLQYPTYPRKQPLPVPESSRQRGLTQAIRWRPNAGWIHVELPLDLRRSVYDVEKGGVMGRGVAAAGGEIGNSKNDGEDEEGNVTDSRRKKKRVQPKQEDEELGEQTKRLEKIRLESDVMPNMTKYCVGVMRDQALHLTHLDRVVQLRPSMHHLDGLDILEAQEKRSTARLHGAGEDSDAEGAEAEQAKEQAAKKKKAMSYNVSFQGDGGRGPGGPGGGGANTSEKDQLMASKRRAEAEEWVDLEWRDLHGRAQHRSEVLNLFSSQLFAGSKTKLKCKTKPRDYLPERQTP